MRAVLASCVALLTIASCTKYHSPTAPGVTTGQLVVTVLDAASGSGIPDVTVEIRRAPSGPVAFTVITNAAGIARLAVSPGTWWVNAVLPGGYLPAGTAGSHAQLAVGAGATAALTISLRRQ